MKKAYIALGSNWDDAVSEIGRAICALSLIPGVRVEAESSLYRTKPWGVENQPDFINAAVRVSTSLSPEALLGVCLGIEAGMGRVREVKNGPRVIDLDLLLYEGEKRNTPELTLPHPRMNGRPFVTVPLSEIAEGFASEYAAEDGHRRWNSDTPGGVLKIEKKYKISVDNAKMM